MVLTNSGSRNEENLIFWFTNLELVNIR